MEPKEEKPLLDNNDLSVVWENRELDLEAIEADSERDVKPDLEELNKLLQPNLKPIDLESRVETRMQSLRSAISSAANNHAQMEENLNALKEQHECMYDEYQSLQRQVEESLLTKKVHVQKMNNRILSLRLESDEKLTDVYFQKERYSCDLLIQQRQCDLSVEHKRKQSMKISNMKKDVNNIEKDIQKEAGLLGEFDANCETLEKDVNMLENMNTNLHNSLIELENSVDMVVRLSLEFKENLARKVNCVEHLKKENKRLLEKNQNLVMEIKPCLIVEKENSIAGEEISNILSDTLSYENGFAKLDEKIEKTRSELTIQDNKLKAAELKIRDYNLQATKWAQNKAELCKIKQLLEVKAEPIQNTTIEKRNSDCIESFIENP